MVDIIMGCFVAFSALAFVIAHVLLASKKLQEWFDKRQSRKYPGSVDVTLNQMNVYSDERGQAADYNLSRHAAIESQPGGKRK